MSLRYNRITVLGSHLRFLLLYKSYDKIIIGASGQKIKGFLPTEEKYFDVESFKHWSRFKRESLSEIISEHVWEHLEYPSIASMYCWQYLKPKGVLILAVPDGDDPEQVKTDKPPNWGHKHLFTFRMLKRILLSAGFEKIQRIKDSRIIRQNSLIIKATK